ncbi:MAG: hypothetical protein ACE5FA_13045, partial [Dehalococcoidia bacterium]
MLCPVAHTFTHRDQPDHGGRADEDTQRSQAGAHLLQ